MLTINSEPNIPQGMTLFAGSGGGLVWLRPNEESGNATTQFGTSTINDLAYSPRYGVYCAVGAGGKISTSTDGINWTARTSGTLAQIDVVTWSKYLGKFVALTSTIALTSTDGTTWTTTSHNLGGGSASRIISSNAHSKLFAVCPGNGMLYSSNDGFNWTYLYGQNTGFSTEVVYDVTVSSTGRLVAVGYWYSGGFVGGAMWNSDNGTTWTYQNSTSSSVDDVTVLRVDWSPTLGLYSAGLSDVWQPIYSTDGSNWTVTSNYLPNPSKIKWLPSAGAFCAVSGTNFYLSGDGMSYSDLGYLGFGAKAMV